jgi:hypothetical protein
LIACIVDFNSPLITPWNWKAWRVVMRRRGAGADHERIVGLQFLPATLVAHVAIVLLVAAVIFDERLVALGQRAGDPVCERFLQGAAEAAALLFDVFYRVGRHQYTSRA